MGCHGQVTCSELRSVDLVQLCIPQVSSIEITRIFLDPIRRASYRSIPSCSCFPFSLSACSDQHGVRVVYRFRYVLLFLVEEVRGHGVNLRTRIEQLEPHVVGSGTGGLRSVVLSMGSCSGFIILSVPSADDVSGSQGEMSASGGGSGYRYMTLLLLSLFSWRATGVGEGLQLGS